MSLIFKYWPLVPNTLSKITLYLHIIITDLIFFFIKRISTSFFILDLKENKRFKMSNLKDKIKPKIKKEKCNSLCLLNLEINKVNVNY